MRTTRVFLLVLALLMLASDFAGAVTAASMDGSAKFRYRCEDTLIPSPKPCDDAACNVACYNLIQVPKQGKCDAVGCKCMIYERQPPMSSN
ncbi:hypothetical protein CFC21_090068 [Triticum aestivum]|uniref:Knottin scorpion toxin-like domain-containing protein n=2 Tax=Triticum aestivum TaxID=4565 RepID=A0A9R1INA9_WHEAT|nr:hypothetical protein CFC21_090068 [Triticum aestivum]